MRALRTSPAPAGSLRDGFRQTRLSRTKLELQPMSTVVNVHQAKTHLSRLLDEVAAGAEVVIAKAGSPVARLVPLDAEPSRPRSLVGFLSGRIIVPDDFDRMGADELAAQFEGTGPAASR